MTTVAARQFGERGNIEPRDVSRLVIMVEEVVTNLGGLGPDAR